MAKEVTFNKKKKMFYVNMFYALKYITLIYVYIIFVKFKKNMLNFEFLIKIFKIKNLFS